MTPQAFINTIYLGDRLFKNILIDGFSEKVKVQVNLISRIRSDSGNWEYYNDENIKDGLLVFSGVESVLLEPKGFVPNDAIEFIKVEDIQGNEQKYLFELGTFSCSKEGEYEQVTIKIIATAIHLEDPSRPNVEITD